MMRVTLTVDVDALTEKEAFALIQGRLRTVDFYGADFTECDEIDNDPTAKMERDLAYGGDVRSESYRDGWRHGG